MTFRIFTNDRGRKNGVFLYSAYAPVEAVSAAEAQKKAEARCAGLPYDGPHGPVKAIEWPATSQTSKDWLAKHVGA